MRATLREVLLYHLLQDEMGEPDGVLSVDETGWEYLSPPVALSQKSNAHLYPIPSPGAYGAWPGDSV